MVYRKNRLHVNNKKYIPLIEHIIKNELKYPVKTANFVQKSADLVGMLERFL